MKNLVTKWGSTILAKLAAGYEVVRTRSAAYGRNFVRWWDRTWFLPLLERMAAFLNRYLASRRGADMPMADWKQECLDDFTAWLSDITEPPDAAAGDLQACDLYTLLSAFAGLHQEIRLQNREQGKAIKALAQLMDDHTAAADLFRTRTRDLADLETRLRAGAEDQVVGLFFDVRDALVRGVAGADEKNRACGGWFGKKKPEAGNTKDGYRLALERMDRAFAACGVAPVKTDGEPFDAERMHAMHTEKVPGTEAGIVVRTVRGGFVKGHAVIRYADVIVSV
ncbi:MAG: nucleotide exchange factor GrpE [Deltaproteobacteria bacterium]|nr:MAG: nucleotide exchange factor GrpE [Deltaproteobacteria bacterium]